MGSPSCVGPGRPALETSGGLGGRTIGGTDWRRRSVMDTAEARRAVAELLHEAAETHHRVYRITDGEDPDWATWYANWLTTLSELPTRLGSAPVRSELTYHLVRLDREYGQGTAGERWEDSYAAQLVEVYGPGG